MKIILFEDGEQNERLLISSISQAIGNSGIVQPFRATQADRGNCIYDDTVEQDLRDAGQDDATLIVADRDLSGLARYSGLSEPTVRRVADKLAIPECGYARGVKEAHEFLDGPELRDGRINVTLERGEDYFARQVVAISAGFSFIGDQLQKAMDAPGRRTAGKVLATILGKPEYAEKITLYASGDQNRLASVLKARSDSDEGLRRLACLLGYWLWDSVLRFPGVIVNEVAASSYLNIGLQAFEAVDVRSIFQNARYAGPFADARGPIWWRGMLDDIVAEAGAEDGRTLAMKILGREVPQSQCCEDPSIPAGYYCMLSGRPVSLKNSRTGLAWFPRGADLARISESKYEEVVPWL